MRKDQVVAERDDFGWVAQFVAAAATGEILNLAGEGVVPDPTQADSWPESQRVPAAELRAALIEIQRHPERVDLRGLRIYGADISDKLDIEHLRLPCPFWLEFSRLQAGANLRGATLPELSLEESLITEGGLVMDAMTVTGGLFAHNLVANGEVRANGANIGGQMNIDGASLSNPGGTALSLDGSTISRGLIAQDLDVTGEVRANGAKIGGQMNIVRAKLSNPDGKALSLDGIAVPGGLFASDLVATGEVRATIASINGQLILSGAELSQPDGIALNLAGTTFTGDLMLNELVVSGEVRVAEASISGQLILSGAKLVNPGGCALRLEGARVEVLWLRDLAIADGVLDLTGCAVASLILPNRRNEMPPGTLSARGWKVGAVHGAIATDAGAAQSWLGSRPTYLPYSPQPARELADLYDRTGHPAQARQLRYSAARRVAKAAPWWAKPWQWFYGGVVGHGYRPMFALGWLLVAFACAWVVVAATPGSFLPTDPDKAGAAVSDTHRSIRALNGKPIPNPITGALPCIELGTYPCLRDQTFGYALAAVVPPTAATQTTAWAPTGWALIIVTALKAAGWVLSVLFLAGISGLLRRT